MHGQYSFLSNLGERGGIQVSRCPKQIERGTVIQRNKRCLQVRVHGRRPAFSLPRDWYRSLLFFSLSLSADRYHQPHGGSSALTFLRVASFRSNSRRHPPIRRSEVLYIRRAQGAGPRRAPRFCRPASILRGLGRPLWPDVDLPVGCGSETDAGKIRPSPDVDLPTLGSHACSLTPWKELQVQSHQTASAPENDLRIRSTMQGLAAIIRSQGFRQLFAGLSLNYLKVHEFRKFPFLAVKYNKNIVCPRWMNSDPILPIIGKCQQDRVYVFMHE